jgi:hypothetical protein
MGCLGDRGESRDETIGGAARRAGGHTQICVRRPEIDSRDESRRDGQNARDQKWCSAQGTIPANLYLAPALNRVLNMAQLLD